MRIKCIVNDPKIGFTFGKEYGVQREVLLLNKYYVMDDMGELVAVNTDSPFFEKVKEDDSVAP